MSKIQKIKADLVVVNGLGGRVETGPLQINDDWPCTFIRGDDSFAYIMALQYVLKLAEEAASKNPELDLMTIYLARGLLETLQGCILNNPMGEDDE